MNSYFGLGKKFSSNSEMNIDKNSYQTPPPEEEEVEFPITITRALKKVKDHLVTREKKGKSEVKIVITSERVIVNEQEIDVEDEIKIVTKSNYAKIIRKMAAINEDEIDKIDETINVNLTNTSKENLEKLIEQVNILENKKDQDNRGLVLTFFFVGKIFYEKVTEKYRIKKERQREEKELREILSSYKEAGEWKFGENKLRIKEIRERVCGEWRQWRLYVTSLRVFITFSVFAEPEVQIRKAEYIPGPRFFRELSVDKFLDFFNQLCQFTAEELEEGKIKQ